MTLSDYVSLSYAGAALIFAGLLAQTLWSLGRARKALRQVEDASGREVQE